MAASWCGAVRVSVVAICGSGPVLSSREMGWVGCCNASQGRTGQGRAGQGKQGRQGQGRRQGTAVRRIEGFEKRQRAKPRRRLSHPPAFVRAFQDPPTPLGECRVVLPASLPLPGLRGTSYALPCAFVCVSFFCGREPASAATVVLASDYSCGQISRHHGVYANCVENGNSSGRKYFLSRPAASMSCQAGYGVLQSQNNNRQTATLAWCETV